VDLHIGFLGGGAMGEALIHGVLKKRLVSPEKIIVYDVRPDRLQELKNTYNIEVACDREELVRKSDTIILAFKPQNLREALAGIKVERGQLVISIIAGVTLNRLASYFGEVPVVRVIPNTPALVGEGITAMAGNDYTGEEDLNKALEIFSSVGEVLVLPEEQLNAVTGLSGSGPAFIYTIIEALTDGGVKQGLARPVALKLAARTVLGAARMVLVTGEHPAVLKDKVTSPAGTTIAGMAVLEEEGIRAALIKAVEVACRRAESLNKE